MLAEKNILIAKSLLAFKGKPLVCLHGGVDNAICIDNGGGVFSAIFISKKIVEKCTKIRVLCIEIVFPIWYN